MAKKSLDFADKSLVILDQVENSRNHYRLFEQFESAVASISQNIAEGK